MENEIEKMIEKFPNGKELYQKNAIFNNIIHSLIEGANVYAIIEDLIISIEKHQKAFVDYAERDTRPIVFLTENNTMKEVSHDEFMKNISLKTTLKRIKKTV